MSVSCPFTVLGRVMHDRRDVFRDASGLLWKPRRIHTAASENEGPVVSDRDRGVDHNGNLFIDDSVSGSYRSEFLSTAVHGPEGRPGSPSDRRRSRRSENGVRNTPPLKCCSVAEVVGGRPARHQRPARRTVNSRPSVPLAVLNRPAHSRVFINYTGIT